MIKAILVGFSLAGAAAAQIAAGAPSAVPASSGPSSSAPEQTPSASAVDNTQQYGQYSQESAQPTEAPSSSSNIYEMMPYSSYQNGGYKSLECGYGYKKADDGSCQAESWVR
jgi:hypothetical protein